MPGRRPSVAFVALSAASLSACIHVSAPVAPFPPPDESAKVTARAVEANQPPRMEFAVLPKVPGTVVPAKPNANANPPADTVAKKPATTAPSDPPKPVPPVQTLTAVEPRAFPVTSINPTEAPLLAAVRAYTEGRADRA